MTRGGTADGELRTATVTRAPLKQTIVAPGAMTTAGDVRLAFKVPGKLAQVSVTVGQATDKNSWTRCIGQHAGNWRARNQTTRVAT